MRQVNISPHALGRTDDCLHCAWFKHRSAKPPGKDFEDFRLLDRFQRDSLPEGTILDEIGIPGAVIGHEMKVISQPRQHGKEILWSIFGYADTVVKLHEGEYAIVERKSSKPKTGRSQEYDVQANAYAWGLEHHENPTRILKVDRIFVAYFTIFDAVANLDYQKWTAKFAVTVDEVPRTDDRLIEKITARLDALSSATPPPANPNCSTCQYLSQRMKIRNAALQSTPRSA